MIGVKSGLDKYLCHVNKYENIYLLLFISEIISDERPFDNTIDKNNRVKFM